MTRLTRWLWAAAAATTAVAIVVAGASRLDPMPRGLAASYFSSPDSSTLAVTAIDPVPSADRIAAAWNGAPPVAFTAIWRGAIFLPDAGPYTLEARSDGDASIYVDGRAIVDGEFAPSQRGSHTIAVSYVHRGGPVRFELLWARARGALEPIPSWALRPQPAAAMRILFSRWQPSALVVVEWVAVVTFTAAAALTLACGALALFGHLRREDAFPELGWILAASTVLNVIGIRWGLFSWATAEVVPLDVISGLAARFSHGWYNVYPPLHFVLMALVTSPILMLGWLGRIDVDGWFVGMLLVYRAVSVIMASGVVISVYVSGRLAFGRRAALFAAAMFALVTPFVFYAKLANVDVPYLFWFSLSLVFYLRLLEGGRTRDFAWCAAAATCAICTKDQAYGLYALMPLVILWEQWRARGRTARAWLDAIFNRQVGVAVLVAAIVFAIEDNVLFNFDGFLSHAQMIVGPRSETYRVFAPTLTGRWDLLRLTIDLTQQAWGWPFFLACLAGVAVSAADARSRRVAVWLLVPIAGYYLTFINVILYNYDRFMLPACLVLALFGGVALDRVTRPGAARAWRVAAASIAFVYALLYSGTVDVLMLGDSRYAVERWFAGRLAPDDVIGQNVSPDYLPRLPQLQSVPTIADLHVVRPRYFVLNVDYLRGVPSDTPEGRLIAGLERHELEYALVYRARTPSPWPWLPGAHRDLVGPRLDPLVFSMLRNLNPTIDVFERESSVR